MRADLHVHTTMSDGSETCVEVLEQARRRGVSCVAITNHDTTRGLDKALALSGRLGVRVVGGVEVSAWDGKRGRKVHVLGYGLGEDSPAIATLCDPLLRRRDENSSWQLDRLIAAGFDIDVDRVSELRNASTCLYKQHLMDALTDAPYSSVAYRELYHGLFKDGGICDREIDYVDARDAVRAIVEDGGVAVLAHPGQLKSYEILPELVACGLSGIEQYHPDHTPIDYVRCMRLAERHDLLLTGGSDYHGRFGGIPHPGYRIPSYDLPIDGLFPSSRHR